MEETRVIFRYSMLDSFVSCPYGFKRRYIDKIPDTEKSSALEYGTALHLAINTHFEGGDGVEVFKLYWDSLKDTEMVYYRHSWTELRNLAVNQFLPNFIRLHSKKFQDLKLEETIEIPFLDHSISGTFDAAGMYDGVLTVSDWKTSSREYRKDKIDKNPQMYIYAEIYRHKYGVLPNQLMYKVFRKDNGSIQTLKTELTEEKLKLQLENVSSIIKSMLHCIETNNWYHSFECYCKEETK
jgi:hypothetical protein